MFRRSQPETTTADQPTDEVAVDDSASGKGRPTPKRREAEAARKTALKVPADPKAARKAMRERERKERAIQREAMLRGDERALPPRDRGPAKAFTRNWVDSRRLVTEYFLPVMLVILVLTLLPIGQVRYYASFSWYFIMIAMVGALVFTGWRLRSALIKEFPDKADRKGAVFYGIMRGMQIRRLRIPLPKVKPGGAPVTPKSK